MWNILRIFIIKFEFYPDTGLLRKVLRACYFSIEAENAQHYHAVVKAVK